jgi:hypothetical protein
LNRKLENAAEDRGPREIHYKLRLRRMPAEEHSSGDHSHVHRDRSRVGEKESPVAVEDSEAPGTHDEHSGAWEEDPDQMDCQFAVFACKTGDDKIDQQRRREDANQDERSAYYCENPKNGAGNMLGLFILLSRAELRIHSNERRGEHALSEQVAQQIGDPNRGAEDAGNRRITEEMCNDSLTYQPSDAADQDS